MTFVKDLSIVILYPPSGYPKKYTDCWGVSISGANGIYFQRELGNGKVESVSSTLPFLIIKEETNNERN